jgi:hypothetical protein
VEECLTFFLKKIIVFVGVERERERGIGGK